MLWEVFYHFTCSVSMNDFIAGFTTFQLSLLFDLSQGALQQSNCKLQVYYMSTKTKLNVIYCKYMFHSHSILKSTFPTPSTFPS